MDADTLHPIHQNSLHNDVRQSITSLLFYKALGLNYVYPPPGLFLITSSIYFLLTNENTISFTYTYGSSFRSEEPNKYITPPQITWVSNSGSVGSGK